MFDASAYALAEFEYVDDGRSEAMTLNGEPLPADADATEAVSGLDVAMAACSLCAQTFGGCAVGGAKAGMVSPALALSVCGWMQRAAGRAANWSRTGRSTTYAAYVLFGRARSHAQREADVLALAETMR